MLKIRMTASQPPTASILESGPKASEATRGVGGGGQRFAVRRERENEIGGLLGVPLAVQRAGLGLPHVQLAVLRDAGEALVVLRQRHADKAGRDARAMNDFLVGFRSKDADGVV